MAPCKQRIGWSKLKEQSVREGPCLARLVFVWSRQNEYSLSVGVFQGAPEDPLAQGFVTFWPQLLLVW